MKYGIGLILLFLYQNGFGQKPWSLNQCIEQALTNNITISQGQVNSEILKRNAYQAKYNRLPSVSASANHNYNFGRNIDPFTNQFIQQSVQSNAFSISANMTLFNGFQLKNNQKLAELNLMSNQSDIEVIKNNISLNIVNQYLQILFATEMAKIIENREKSTQAQLDNAKVLFEAGSITQNTVLDLEAKLTNDKLEKLNTQNNKIALLQNLAIMLQIPNNEPFDIEIPNLILPTETVIPSIDEMYKTSLEMRPEIKSAKLKMKANEIEQAIAKGGFYPRLSLYSQINTVYTQSRKEIKSTTPDGFRIIGITQNSLESVVVPNFIYQLQTTPFNTQISDNLGKSIGISLQVPIYSNHRNINNVKLSQLNMKLKELELKKANDQLYNDILIAYQNYTSAKSKYFALQSSEIAFEKAYNYNKQRFEFGTLNSTDLLNSKINYDNAISSTLQGKYEYIFRKVLLDFYQGKSINF